MKKIQLGWKHSIGEFQGFKLMNGPHVKKALDLDGNKAYTVKEVIIEKLLS